MANLKDFYKLTKDTLPKDMYGNTGFCLVFGENMRVSNRRNEIVEHASLNAG